MDYNILDNSLITGGSGMVGYNINFGNKPSSLEMNISSSKSIDNYISKINNISCILLVYSIKSFSESV